jgi:DNA mismatch endonuclease, patch repair protein
MDHVSPERRSHIMRLVKPINNKTEIAVRRILHALGFRFRLHGQGLPGKPDVILPKWRTIVMIHGCFWHRHAGCRKATTPKTKRSFWKKKFDANVKRDRRVHAELEGLGWRICVVWQCELASPAELAKRLDAFIRVESAHLQRGAG